MNRGVYQHYKQCHVLAASAVVLVELLLLLLLLLLLSEHLYSALSLKKNL